MSTRTTPKTRREKTVLLVESAMLTAIIVIMAFTPLGYLRIGPLELTLIMIPVLVGAVTQGPAIAAFLGGVFGVTSFMQCFMGSPLGAVLVSVSVARTFIVCVVSRVLAGFLCGLLFRACAKRDKKRGWSFFVAGFSGSLFNTIFFLGLLAICFWTVQFTPEQAVSLGGVDTVLKTVIALAVGINAPVELIVCTVLGAAIGKGVSLAVQKLR